MSTQENLPAAAEPGALDQALAGIRTVAEFQLRRLLTKPRLALAALGVIFPAAVMLAANRAAAGRLNDDMQVAMLYGLIPEAVCMLGLLVTMCPAVADELERGTWAHLAVRPGGRRSLLLGTWVAAVIWTAAVGIAATALAVLATDLRDPWGVARILGALVLISCVGRAALFALPAVVMPKRALVASVGVALVVEYLAGVIPAVVNQATVSLRLRTLLVSWMGWERQLPTEAQLFIDRQPEWVQLLAVGILVAVLLTVAVAILDRRQFPPSDEI
jgi:ABC-type transport system involved in multi-copper enzyme maturation permease subunit